MLASESLVVAIVDYGLCNLFSVKHACEHMGFRTAITSSPSEIRAADGVILPGVGAFENAMRFLRDNGLVDVIRDIVEEGKPLVGICLGMQLLMTESNEFGVHRGLDIVAGRVSSLDSAASGVKVPHIGWNRIRKVHNTEAADAWAGTPLAEVTDGEYMYFVHSYYVEPQERGSVMSVTEYGGVEFCSSLMRDNIFACQYHPERSGVQGLKMYQNIANFIRGAKG
jgi:imidazole glycerol-phosphate synthase subunit HisH